MSAEEKQTNSKSNLQLPSGPQHCLNKNSRIPHKIIATVEINAEWKVKALFDSGSSERFIHHSLVEAAAITMHPSSTTICMASSAFSTKVTGYCIVNLTYQGWVYEGIHLSALPRLTVDLILGLDFQSQHENRIFNYGSKPSLSIYSLH